MLPNFDSFKEELLEIEKTAAIDSSLLRSAIDAVKRVNSKAKDKALKAQVDMEVKAPTLMTVAKAITDPSNTTDVSHAVGNIARMMS